MGWHSPYFAATGIHSLFPLDIFEATYPLPPPESVLCVLHLVNCRSWRGLAEAPLAPYAASDVFEGRIRAASAISVPARKFGLDAGPCDKKAIELEKSAKDALDPPPEILRGAEIICKFD